MSTPLSHYLLKQVAIADAETFKKNITTYSYIIVKTN